MQMRTIKKYLLIALLQLPLLAGAQEYDLLIKNGKVIDPKNKVDENRDVAVKDGKIVKVAANLAVTDAKKWIDAKGLIVTPGLIDIHTHVFVGGTPEKFANGSYSVSPDDFTFRAGITTVVDAGTSGWRNFPQFKEQVIDKSKTRILAFLNISGNGMTGGASEQNLSDMDAFLTAMVAKENPDIIVGVKIGHYEGKDWAPFDRALDAAKQFDHPLFVECHLPQYTLEEQLNKMRPGDIITHSYEKVDERMAVTDEQDKVRPFVLDAQKKGVLFDVGHGGAGFWFSVAIPAYKQGLAPNTFGTDLHRFSMNAGMKDMLNVMSKYFNLGMSIEDVVLRATWNAAKSIKKEDLGSLTVGSAADIALIRITEGDFGYIDAGGFKLKGNKKLIAELTVRAGKVVWDLNGLSGKPLEK